MTLYTSNGRETAVDAEAFGAMPEGAIALKFNDEISDAEWITDEDRLSELRREDAPLAYVARPEDAPVPTVRQMIRWNKSGEVQVVDARAGVASNFLHHSERELPLESYELDNDFDPAADTDYTVIR